MWVRLDGRRTPRSQQRVREGGHRVARTTVDDRMNEYVHEWAMQRERGVEGQRIVASRQEVGWCVDSSVGGVNPDVADTTDGTIAHTANGSVVRAASDRHSMV